MTTRARARRTHLVPARSRAEKKVALTFDPVVELAGKRGRWAQVHGAAVGLKQDDEAALHGILEELVGKPAGMAAFRSAKISGRALAPARIGDQWSNAWQTADLPITRSRCRILH